MNKRWNDEESCWFVLRAQTKREHIAAKILSDVEGVEVSRQSNSRFKSIVSSLAVDIKWHWNMGGDHALSLRSPK